MIAIVCKTVFSYTKRYYYTIMEVMLFSLAHMLCGCSPVTHKLNELLWVGRASLPCHAKEICFEPKGPCEFSQPLHYGLRCLPITNTSGHFTQMITWTHFKYLLLFLFPTYSSSPSPPRPTPLSSETVYQNATKKIIFVETIQFLLLKAFQRTARLVITE